LCLEDIFELSVAEGNDAEEKRLGGKYAGPMTVVQQYHYWWGKLQGILAIPTVFAISQKTRTRDACVERYVPTGDH
jgi:hypothetical protein